MTAPRPALLFATCLAAAIAGTAKAECNCNRSGPSTFAPAMAAPVVPYIHAYPSTPVPPGLPVDDRCGGRCNLGQSDAAPPPGTLGRTYSLCSRPLPEGEHPRNAGLEIRAADVVRIDVERMDGYLGEDRMWHFLTEMPWLPGRPAIVHVVIERVSEEGALVKDVRVVRLIPGRILSVEF